MGLVRFSRRSDRKVFEYRCCDSVKHADRSAEALVHWPIDGPIEYCAECAAIMTNVAQVLGLYVHVEPIPLPEWMAPRQPSRAIDLKGAG